MNPNDVLPFVFAAFGLCCAVWVLRPLITALAHRLAGGAKGPAGADELTALRAELLDEVHQVRHDLGELAERVDFTERLLAKQREAQALPPGRR